MMYSQVLLLFVITAVRVDCEVKNDIPLIQWDADCDSYNVTSGVYPRARDIHGQSSTPLAQCRSRCTSRTDCGGFAWDTGNYCFIYNINDHIIEQVTHVPQNWYHSWSASYTWYSKSCGYSLGATDLSCTSYTDRVYDNLGIDSKWWITYTWGWIPDLTATECQAWCTLHTGCRTVTYERYNIDGSGDCSLHSTTIRDLLDSGLTGDVWQNTNTDYTYTTYDRYCAGGQPYIPVVPEVCGVQDIANTIGNGDAISKIVGGTIAVSGSWPWQVQLKAYGQHQCGGSILSSEWILTAAKCFNMYPDTSAWTVHAGSWMERYIDSTESIHPVSSIVVHSQYSADAYDNDIALVKLSIPVTFTTHRQPVCLPESGLAAQSVPPGTMCYVTGWGLTHGTGYAYYLKQTYLPIVGETTCRLAHPGVITSNMLCAGYSNVNTHRPCHGDNGGPLVRESASGVWYLEGVVSYMDEYCTDVNKPAVFTSTRAYTNWIHNTMGLH